MMDFTKNNFIFFGHRGAPMYAPENTMVSFEKAIEMGVQGVELDVLLTNDDKVVVFHDLDFNRMAGINKKVKDYSYNEILNIDISNKWHEIYGIQKAPLLEDVIDLIKKHNVILNIEIKSTGIFPTKIVNKVVETINSKQVERQCIVSSFNPLILRKLKNISPNIFTSIIWRNKKTSFLFKNYRLMYFISKSNGFHANKNFINTKLVLWMKNKKIPIYVYTVNSNADLEEMKKIGINGVFTDDPEIMKK